MFKRLDEVFIGEVLNLNALHDRVHGEQKPFWYDAMYELWIRSYLEPPYKPGANVFGAFRNGTLVSTVAALYVSELDGYVWDHWRVHPEFSLIDRDNAKHNAEFMNYVFDFMRWNEGSSCAYICYEHKMAKAAAALRRRYISSDSCIFDSEIIEIIPPGGKSVSKLLEKWVTPIYHRVEMCIRKDIPKN